MLVTLGGSTTTCLPDVLMNLTGTLSPTDQFRPWFLNLKTRSFPGLMMDTDRVFPPVPNSSLKLPLPRRPFGVPPDAEATPKNSRLLLPPYTRRSTRTMCEPWLNRLEGAMLPLKPRIPKP